MMVRLPDEYGTERWINPDRVRSLSLHPVGAGEWVLNITAGGKGETATGTEAQMRALARKITGHHEESEAVTKAAERILLQPEAAKVAAEISE